MADPKDKIRQFYDAMRSNPNITGIPSDYNTFESAMQDPEKARKFYDAIKTNPNIKGLPDTYDKFYTGLGIPPGKQAPVGTGAPAGQSQKPSEQPQTASTGERAYSFTFEPEKPVKGKKPEPIQNQSQIFSQYEEKQKAYADETKVDFGKPEDIIRYTGQAPVSGAPGKMQRGIAEGIHNKRLEITKRESEQAQKQMSEQLRPIVSETVKGDNYKKYTMRDSNGVIDVVDPYKIGEEADRIAAEYGQPTDGYFRRFVANTLKSEVSFKILEPETNRIFEEKAGPLITEREKKVADSVQKMEAEKFKAEQGAKLVVADLSAQQDEEIKAISDGYSQMTNEANAQWQQVEQAHQSGQIPDDQYTAAYEQYKQSFPPYEAYVKQINEVNTKYNQRLKREIAELEKQANQKMDALEVPADPALTDRLNKIYQASYQEAFINQEKALRAVEESKISVNNPMSMMGSALVDHFMTATGSAFGSSLKGYGVSLGSQSVEDLGAYLESRYAISPPDTKEFSDLLEPANLANLSGQLAGSMAIPLVASATATMATGGGAAGMVAGALTSWGAETADIVGRARADAFERTGSAGEAEIAAKRSLDSQADIVLAYALDGLPFAGNVLKNVPTKVGRMAVGATSEVVTEFAQEFPQNIAEQNISQGNEPWANLQEKLLNKEEAKQTLISIAPVAILGAGGQIASKSKKAAQADLGAYYGAKMAQEEMNTVVPDQGRQFLQNIVFNEGDAVARAAVASMYTGGSINEDKLAEMNAQIDESVKVLSSANEAKLSPNDAVIYGFYSGRANEARQKAAATEDPILAKVFEQQAKDYESAAVEFLKSGEPDLVVMRYKDGSEVLMSPEDARQAFKNPTTLKEFEKGNVQFMAYGKQSEKAVNEFGKQVEEKAKADAQRKTEEAAAAEVEAAKQESIKLAAENIDKKLREGGEVDIDGFVFVSEEKSQPIFDSFTEEQYERYNKAWDSDEKTFSEFVTEEYVKSKAENTNPEFVAAVDRLLGVESGTLEADYKTVEEYTAKAAEASGLTPVEVVMKEALGEPVFTMEDVENLIKDNEIEEAPCPPGFTSKAEHGATTGFRPGGKWEIVTEFKGKTHDEGGIDIEIKGGSITHSDKEGRFKAEDGAYWNMYNPQPQPVFQYPGYSQTNAIHPNTGYIQPDMNQFGSNQMIGGETEYQKSLRAANAQGALTTAVAGFINPVLGAVVGAGQSLGRKARLKAESTNESGDLVNRRKARRMAVLGSFLDPLKAITTRASYKGGFGDLSGKKYLDMIEASAKEPLLAQQRYEEQRKQQMEANAKALRDRAVIDAGNNAPGPFGMPESQGMRPMNINGVNFIVDPNGQMIPV